MILGDRSVNDGESSKRYWASGSSWQGPECSEECIIDFRDCEVEKRSRIQNRSWFPAVKSSRYIGYVVCCSWYASPYSPGERMHFMNYQLVRYIPFPYFILTNLMEFLLLEKRKIELNIYLPNILNLQPRTIGNKRKYKEIESDGPNKSLKRSRKVTKYERK